MRWCAADALAECVDAALAAHVPTLAGDEDQRVRLAAARMVRSLPPEAFAMVQPAALTLLLDKNVEVRLEAACALAARKDAAGARALLDFWDRPAPRPTATGGSCRPLAR